MPVKGSLSEWIFFALHMLGIAATYGIWQGVKSRREALEARAALELDNDETVDQVPPKDRHTVFVDGKPDSF